MRTVFEEVKDCFGTGHRGGGKSDKGRFRMLLVSVEPEEAKIQGRFNYVEGRLGEDKAVSLDKRLIFPSGSDDNGGRQHERTWSP
jgi:hypothetical protein